MKGKENSMEIEIVGIDLGKTLFHLVGLDATGRVVVRKRCSRAQLLAFTSNIRVQRIGMEACSGAHFLARALQQQGHDVRLMPAQYVKPYVKTNKSDYIDAEAIAEAVQRPSMRFVPVKTEEQLDLQAIHRVRERWVMRRTAVINQIRGLLLERGITVPKGRNHLEEVLPDILAEEPTRFSECIFVLLAQLRIELDQLSERIEEMDALLARISKENEACQRLTTIPGVGPVTATALVAAIGNGSAFRKGRDLAAWVGMVPREHSTGGKQKLLGISKHGNSYLRRLFVQCSRSIIRFRDKPSGPFGAWLKQLMSHAHQNLAVVALANKLLRIAWAVLFRNEKYRSPTLNAV
jgi:transposase